MGKGKGRGDEHACRVNYLFQAGKMVAKDAPQLSQYYGQVLTVITEKTAPKKDFTMKRSMCKKCHTVLEVGQNATYRLRKNRHKKGSPNMIISCQLCGETKRIPTSKGYRLKAETNGQINGSGSGDGTRRVSPPASTTGDGNNGSTSTSTSKPDPPPPTICSSSS